YTFIGWNTASPSATGLADKRVRQALAYGIDMDAVIKAVVFGEATKQVAHHVPVQWAYPTVALEPYKYDKAKAQQLLKYAGWVAGSDGINATAKPEAFQGLVTKLTTGDQTLEATIIGWSLGGDPDPYQIWHSSQIPDPAKNVTG